MTLPDWVQKALLTALIGGIPSGGVWLYKEVGSAAEKREAELRHTVQLETELKLKNEHDKDLLDYALLKIQCGAKPKPTN